MGKLKQSKLCKGRKENRSNVRNVEYNIITFSTFSMLQLFLQDKISHLEIQKHGSKTMEMCL